jgi:regulator of sirC expression with transglutaminase-like and TPR domain
MSRKLTMHPLQPTPLADIGTCEDSELDLIRAAIVLAALDHRQADVAAAHHHIDAMTTAALRLGATEPRARAELLADIIHRRFGYTGDRDSYDDPANANMLRVIERRRGLPVALAILYLGIASRLGWEAAGLNVPGHFFIRIGDADSHVLQDPFDGGAILSTEEVPLKLAPLGLTRDQIRPAMFNPLPMRAVLVRLLNNLAARAEATKDLRRALELHERMTIMAPHFTGLWWEKARLERALGRLSAARASLTNMLETTRDPLLTKHVRNAIAALARTLN